MTYQVGWSSRARRNLDRLPAPVAAAVLEFAYGPLAANPQRVGKQLRPPLDDHHSARRGEYRVPYTIMDVDQAVIIMSVEHRRGAYRTP